MTGKNQHAKVALSDVPKWMAVEESFTVSEEDMETFGRISGDLNPLHTDDSYARANGFQGRVVYGAFLLARLSRLIGMLLPGRNVMWVYNDIQFKKPVYVGDAVTIKAAVKNVSEAAQVFEMDIAFEVAKQKIAQGKAGIKLLT